MNRREEILAKARSVQFLPPAALQVVRLFRDSDVSIRELTRAIEFDPGLTSDVLRLANSAYFGCSYEVGSVRDAILRLGTKSVFRAVVAAAFSLAAKGAVRGYDLGPGQLWEHSMAVALAAGRLASGLGILPRDELFTAAILHDVGKIVLGTTVEVDGVEILEAAGRERVSFEVAEQRVLGIDHAEVGSVLLQSWNLPAEIVEVVRWHHQPAGSRSGSTHLDVVHVADAVCILSGIATGVEGLQYRPCPQAAARLSLKNRLLEEVTSHLLADLGEVRNTFAYGSD
ncbi:MAG: HDOD domain-containing protein [bacterium]